MSIFNQKIFPQRIAIQNLCREIRQEVVVEILLKPAFQGAFSNFPFLASSESDCAFSIQIYILPIRIALRCLKTPLRGFFR